MLTDYFFNTAAFLEQVEELRQPWNDTTFSYEDISGTKCVPKLLYADRKFHWFDPLEIKMSLKSQV